MFDFWKLKRNSLEENDSTSSNKEENGATAIGAGYAATAASRASTQQAAQKFSKPESYTGNRTLYDSGAAKRQAKMKLFENGNVVIDPYTGEKLVLTIKEAKTIYGNDWAKHLAESDHVKPLERIHEQAKGNVWVTNDDIKSVANSDDNLRVSSRNFNNPKRSRTNQEYVNDSDYLNRKNVGLTEKGKQAAIRDGEIAEESISTQLNNASVRNIIQTGHEAGMSGAQYAGVTALTMSGILNIVDVIEGKKNCEEAIEDTIKDSGKAAVTGYAMGGGLTVASQSLSDSSSEFVQSLIDSNIPGKVITAVIVTGDTLRKYAQGEISTQECMIELGEKGLNMATMGYSMAVGQALIPIPIVGGAVGALVGSILTSTYYHNLIYTLQTKELEHQERLRIIEECHKAAEQTKAFRKELENYLDTYFQDYKNCFDLSLSEMRFAYQVGDADGMIAGANQITRKLGGNVYFENVQQFKEFLDDGSTDIL